MVALIAAHQVLQRMPGWVRVPGLFWLVQLVHIGVACALFAIGLPSLPGGLQIFNWIFALLLLWHAIQNNSQFSAHRKVLRPPADRDARRREIAEALARGAASAQAPEEPGAGE